MTRPRLPVVLTDDEIYLGVIKTPWGLSPYASGPQLMAVFVGDRWFTQRWDTKAGERIGDDVEQFARRLVGIHQAQARRVNEVQVTGCRPEDRAMLQTPAGQELVKAATAALRSDE